MIRDFMKSLAESVIIQKFLKRLRTSLCGYTYQQKELISDVVTVRDSRWILLSSL